MSCPVCGIRPAALHSTQILFEFKETLFVSLRRGVLDGLRRCCCCCWGIGNVNIDVVAVEGIANVSIECGPLPVY